MVGSIFVPRCHLGQVALYDTVTKLGWSVDVRTHGIAVVIEKILHEDWELPTEDTNGREVPEIMAEEDCVVSLDLLSVCLNSF